MKKPRELNVKQTVIGATVLILATTFTYLWIPGRHQTVRGKTMGTTYSVQLSHFKGWRFGLKTLQRQLDERLAEINRQMSTYIPDSEISRFNQNRTWNPIRVSPDLALVTRYAFDLSQSTGGAFDPTVEPLVRLWGFGSAPRRTSPPTKEEVAAELRRCGYTHLQRPAHQQLLKNLPELELDLSAVAKGFAVDDLMGLLLADGYTNCYVEIGGEVRVHGTNPDGEAWRIGIDRPDPDRAPGAEPIRVLRIRDRAVASSGDYRNFFEAPDGTRYAHILDPRTGYPVTNGIAATTAVADSCMEADGIATALLVMGAEEGLRWVESRKGVEALIITRTADGSFEQKASSGFDAYASP